MENKEKTSPKTTPVKEVVKTPSKTPFKTPKKSPQVSSKSSSKVVPSKSTIATRSITKAASPATNTKIPNKSLESSTASATNKTSPKNVIRNTILETFVVTRKVGIAYDERMTLHLLKRGKHPERPERIVSIYKELKDKGLLQKCIEVPCRIATKEELLTVHPEKHITTIEETKQKVIDREGSPVYFNSDTYASEGSYDSSLIGIGGLIDLANLVLESKLDNGFAIIRPPGHHCERDVPQGFCLFNNVAICAMNGIQSLKAKKILIIDWDVHHGNGTESILINNNEVLYFSVHRYDNGTFYPRTGSADQCGTSDGEGFNVNVPWDGINKGDLEYLEVFRKVLLPIGKEFSPDLIIISAGFDCAEGDPIGQLNVTPKGFANMTSIVLEICPKVVIALEGGYNLEAISKSAAACVEVLLGKEPEKIEEGELNESAITTINKTIEIQRKYWNCFKVEDLDDTIKLLEKVSISNDESKSDESPKENTT